MFPRMTPSKLISRWIIATVGASLLALLSGGLLTYLVSLAPGLIWRGQLWRLVTWVFVERSPLQLVLACAAIYKFGGELTTFWGERRLARYMLEVILAAAAITSVLAIVIPPLAELHRAGTWAVDDALVIAWARQFPDRCINLQGLVRLEGHRLITATIAITAIYAMFSGGFPMLPELIVCALACWYPARRLAR
jgi:membrane associated rhomboid family serine protease